jgi:general stress protein 26
MDNTTESNRADGIKKVAELVEAAHICMLTTMTADGKHVSRPMGLQSVEFDGDLWFFALGDSAKATEIQANPSVNVSFSNTKNNEWTSIAGTASVVHDAAKAKELWNPILNAWFNDGLETPNLVLIKVEADSAEYWDGPDSKVVSVLGMLRAAVTHDSEKYPQHDQGTVVL